MGVCAGTCVVDRRHQGGVRSVPRCRLEAAPKVWRAHHAAADAIVEQNGPSSVLEEHPACRMGTQQQERSVVA